MCEPIIVVPLTALEQSSALTCAWARAASARQQASRTNARWAAALMAIRSFYFWGGQFAVDDAPPVVIDDPMKVPCAATLPQLASILAAPPPSSFFGGGKK